MPRIASILIHHRNFPDVCKTVDSILESGIRPQDLVVVDNSEDAHVSTALGAVLPSCSNLIITTNDGYGAAANAGLNRIKDRMSEFDAILVCTHEVRPASSAIPLLFEALSDPRVMVAGPTLIDARTQPPLYWSMGGQLTCLNIPRHVGAGRRFVGTATTYSSAGNIERRSFVDGAFCLYRREVFDRLRFPEQYFLYFEETDLHATVRKYLGDVVWVEESLVSQSSDGIPPYYYGRNMQIFQNRHGSCIQRVSAVPFAIIRRSMSALLGRYSWSNVIAMIHGWLSAWR